MINYDEYLALANGNSLAMRRIYSDTSNSTSAVVCYDCKLSYACGREVSPQNNRRITPLTICGIPYQFKNPMIYCTICSGKLVLLKGEQYRRVRREYILKTTRMNSEVADV